MVAVPSRTSKPRGRDLGLPFPGRPGPFNALTDVPGVAVGFTTIVSDAGPPVRTGVTAIVPRAAEPDMIPAWAGFHALNGNGEMTGVHWIEEAGYFNGPICITNTHSVGIVHHAAVRWMLRRFRHQFEREHLWAMPVVAETYDGVLNDINGQHVSEAHALAALEGAAAGPIAEGNVGGGAGMIAYEFKGGTGTASRRVAVGGGEGTVGVLVQANHGMRDWLTVLGVPVGRHLREDRIFGRETGSIIVIIGTDLPLMPIQLRRLAKRAAIGIGRNGTPGGNNSGDIFLAFGVANPIELPQNGRPEWRLTAVNDELLDPVFEATVEAIEEAVVNAMLAAEDAPTLRPPGKIVRAIDSAALLEVMRAYGRLGPPPVLRPQRSA
jgi:D-aminopeptidase